MQRRSDEATKGETGNVKRIGGMASLLPASLFSVSLCLCGFSAPVDDAKPVKAKLSDMAWMAGTWSGPGLGGQTEEHWTAPGGGSMLGMFRLVNKDGKANVFELLLIEQEGEHVKYRFRHFGPGHKPWEKPDKPLEFDLIEVSESRALFESSVQTNPKRITYRRVGDDELRIRVQGEKDGKLGTGRELVWKRAGLKN